MWSSELAQLLGDARACADACEASLATAPVDTVVAAAAACRVLDDLLDPHPELFEAAVRVCRELATAAADCAPEQLAELLRRVAASASAVLEAGG